jgi:hypothetical protein
MESPERYKSTLAFVDLLFNVLLGFVFLFIVAFILINPIAKQADVKVPAEFMIVMTWPDDDHNDIDLWVADPLGNYVYFARRESGFLNLDRDDLGSTTDMVIVDGKEVRVGINREVVTIRGIISGRYLVSAHYYSDRSVAAIGPIPVTVEVIKLNPYKIVYRQDLILQDTGQVKNFYQFSLSHSGSVTNISASTESAVR